MAGHECYHCKQWIAEGVAHDCWTTSEAALTRDLSTDLQEAWERLREAAVECGDQRVYASHNSIMFSRRSCYFFVRPRRTFLEVCVFLGRTVKAPQISRVVASSKTKFVHVIKITHRDQVEAPVTDWLHEAYDYGAPSPPATRRASVTPAGRTTRASAKPATRRRTARTVPAGRARKRTLKGAKRR